MRIWPNKFSPVIILGRGPSDDPYTPALWKTKQKLSPSKYVTSDKLNGLFVYPTQPYPPGKEKLPTVGSHLLGQGQATLELRTHGKWWANVSVPHRYGTWVTEKAYEF